MQVPVKLGGMETSVLAVCDGGAEVAVLSRTVFEQIEPRPELRPTQEKVRGLFGPERTPLGECTVCIEVPGLAIMVEYDVVVDEIEETLLLDAAFLHYAQIQMRYDTLELSRNGKIVKGVSR